MANAFTLNGTSAWGNAYFYFKNESKNTNYTVTCNALSELARTSGISVYGASDTSGSGLTTIVSVLTPISANIKTKCTNSFNSGNYNYVVIRFWNNGTGTALGSNVTLYISETMLEKRKCSNTIQSIHRQPYRIM